MRIKVLLAAPLLLLAVWLSAQDTVFRVNVDVPVVSVEAIVQDSNGRPVTSLKQSDFQIYEDGQLQEIGYFGSADTPRSILLIFDVTAVMESQGPFMVQGMNTFFKHVRPQDRVAVGVLGPEFEMLVNFRALEPGKTLNVKLPQTRFGSNVYDVLNSAAKRFDKEKGRKAIIVMTDGRDTAMFDETKRLGAVLRLAEDSDFKGRLRDARKREVPLYFLALDTDPKRLGAYDYEYAYLKNPADYQRSPEYSRGQRSPTIAEDYLAGVRLRLEQLAEVTGGRVVYPANLQDIVRMYEQISVELGSSYSLGYSPKNGIDDSKPHRIEVRVGDPALKVIQSRNGFGGGSAAGQKE